MASNPPFNVVEDNTDEDFFDQLVVDDDLGPSSTTVDHSTSSGLKNFVAGEGSDSDEAKAFANLSVEDHHNSGEVEGKKAPGGVELVSSVLDESGNDNAIALDSSNSVRSGGVGELNNEEVGSEQGMADLSESKSIEATKLGVKEVGWSSFYADGSDAFGSHLDFFNELGGTSEDFSANVEGNGNGGSAAPAATGGTSVGLDNTAVYELHGNGTQGYLVAGEESVHGQDLNSIQYWENMYPGWKYDASTGQWYQIDGHDALASAQGTFDANSDGQWGAVSGGKTVVNYLQQTLTSVAGSVAENSTIESVASWNQSSEVSNNNWYPEHMVFDPQYPGWYYDTIAQEWRMLESYNMQTAQPMVAQTPSHQNQNGFAYGGSYSQDGSIYGEYAQAGKYESQNYNSQGQQGSWNQSSGSYSQQSANAWEPEMIAKTDTVPKTDSVSKFVGNQQLTNFYGSNYSDQDKSFNFSGAVPSYDSNSQGPREANGFVAPLNHLPSGNVDQQFNLKQNEQLNFSNNYYVSQQPASVTNQPFQGNQQLAYASDSRRSSAGRPPHALVNFGFGGKLIVMKDGSSPVNSFGSQDTLGGSISVLNLMEVVLGRIDNASGSRGTCSYFNALCQQSFPGPLVGGNVGNKEVNKWLDERITRCESPDMDYGKGEVLRLLFSLLKIACQHYGKLRSPFGTDTSMRESDSPESAVAKLFASAKRNDAQFSEYGSLSHCLQNLPSEGQLRATASEVQNLLVSGRKMEALHCAQGGQLWGPALVLASQLGDQFYIDTIKQMALCQLVPGSPLRTLCLLIAGQPADVFAAGTTAGSGLPGVLNMSQQPMQHGSNSMLYDWEENLALITANRTKDDELVLLHLGDCLWKDRSEVIAAHICYLVAEANFESYSDSARQCLIGADHWKHPRTYVSPDAIQRTEVYEYSRVLGNSQFILLPFQPYKLIYAYMLAEVGKVSDSLKYCQAVLKSLKTGRTPEVETWKHLVSSLEERIKTHQQSGYTANMAPAKLVGKLLNFFDNTAQRVVGGLPPPVPTSQGSIQPNEVHQQPAVPRVSASQSTMAMSSLVPSASMEPVSEWAARGNRMTSHNRSVSEPDIGRTRQVDSSKEGTSPNAQGKTSSVSRFGRFGFGSQLLQKTFGLVLRPRADRQAKLGEANKFYYDEKLKRWVEEGAEPPAEEPALPPPPTTAAFQNGMSDYNLKSALREGSPPSGSPTFKTPATSEHTSGIPPIPSSSNQFSARGRLGVRARYVDTFNQGGGSSTKLFHSPPLPSAKPAIAANTNFFVPAPPPPSSELSSEPIPENTQESTTSGEKHFTSSANESFQSPLSTPLTSMQRFPSMDNITRTGAATNVSRRTASWSGSFNDSPSTISVVQAEHPGVVPGLAPSSFMPGNSLMSHTSMSSGSLGDELHEVEL